MLYVAVCDDCPMQTDVILELLNDYQAERPGIEMEVASFLSGEALLASYLTGSTFDLLLLDILMPELNGIDLAKEIRKQDGDCALIFLTASKDYAIEAFNVYAAHYLVKPVKKDSFFIELDRIITLPKSSQEEYFMVSLQDRDVKIPFSSIVCIELSNRKLRICLENGDELYSKYVREPFDAAISPLLTDSRFFHAHKSYVINFQHVKGLTKDSFIMKNDLHVHISRHRYAKAKKLYFAD